MNDETKTKDSPLTRIILAVVVPLLAGGSAPWWLDKFFKQSVPRTAVIISSCIGRGGVEGVHFWGPNGQTCNGISSWGSYAERHFEMPEQICSCKGHGGVEGVTMWGPEGATCAGISSWGTYNQDCVSTADLTVCSCVGHGNILEGHVLWGPRSNHCGGFSSWGRYSQSCKAEGGR